MHASQREPDSLTAAPRRLVVWCLSDGKPGHRSQSEGLALQLAQRCDLQVEWIPLERWSSLQFLREWTQRTFAPGKSLPDPQLILAAGHSTHLAALAARHARGGRIVVLMRPSLPTGLFDLCLIPEHDLRSGFGRLNRLSVVPTRGVLNAFAPSDSADPREALMLVGGPSQHYGWSDDQLLEQVQQIIHHSQTTIHWTITTSRRTPDSCVRRLQAIERGDGSRALIDVVPYQQTLQSGTGPGWLAQHLQRAGAVFVSEDSVSMVYEALTAGADVGLLEVPRRRSRSRIVRGVDQLIASGLVVTFADWQASRFENRRRELFNEAARCADIVCSQLLDAA